MAAEQGAVFSEELINKANEIASIISGGIKEVYRGCKMYVEALGKYPNIKNYYIRNGADPAHLRRFEEIGRDRLHPELIFKTGNQYKKLAKCPLSEQETYIKEPVEVLLPNGDVLKIKIENLTQEQIKQVFDKSHVRDISDQKSYLKNLESTISIKAPTYKKPYKVYKDKVVINGVSFTKDDLFNILREMK